MPTKAKPNTVQRPEAEQRALRLGVGAGLHFALAILIGWQLSTICTVFVVLFLQAPAPAPVPAIKMLTMQGIVFLSASWVISGLLEPYPVVFLGALALAVATCFYWSTRGAGMLSVVLALMAALMLPTLVITSQQLALILVIWVPVNLFLAWLWTVFMFKLFPPGTMPAGGAAKPGPPPNPERLVWRMSLVTIPFAIYFYLAGSAALVTLLFVAILSQQLAAATAAGPTVAKGMLKANVIGGIAAIFAYNMTIIAPLMLVALLAFGVVALLLAGWLVSDRADASLAGSALSTSVILFGGSIAPFGDDADVKMIDRLSQIGTALVFVLIAYIVVDAFFPLKPREDQPKRRPLLHRLRRDRAQP